MAAVIEQGRHPESLGKGPESERYSKVYARLLADGFADYTNMYNNAFPSLGQLQDWSAYMHAVIYYFGPIAHSSGNGHLDLQLPAEAPRLHHLLLADATSSDMPPPSLKKSLKADPTGQQWIEQQFSQEQIGLGEDTPSRKGVDKVKARVQELFQQTAA